MMNAFFHRSLLAVPLALLFVITSPAGANEFASSKGDGQCPDGYRLATYEEAVSDRVKACKKLSEWAIARLDNGGSMDGRGYRCKIRETDSRELGDSLCVKSPEFISFKGDGSCPEGFRLATYPEASGNRNIACGTLSPWAIARLAGGGSMDGEAYQCKTRESDSRELGDSLCVAGKQQPDDSPVNPGSADFVPADGYYRFKTMFQGAGKCLEGNEFAPASTLSGAAFMDSCQNVSGQLWKFVAENDGYYRLKTLFQGNNKCLEGNEFSPDATLNGAAFMDNCQNVSGQLWKIVPAGNGYSRLKTLFQGDNKCLEGNKFAATSTLGGAAFMDNCQNVSGQLWKFEPQ